MAGIAHKRHTATYRNHYTFSLHDVRQSFNYNYGRGMRPPQMPYAGEWDFLGIQGMLEVMRRASKLYYAEYNGLPLHALDRPKINRERFQRASMSLQADNRYPQHPMQLALIAKYNQHNFDKVRQCYLQFSRMTVRHCEANRRQYENKLAWNVMSEWIYDACLLGRRQGFDPKWRTDAVIGLCNAMYVTEDFGPMPLLADALEEAGCGLKVLLGHLRTFQNFTRANWAMSRVMNTNRYK